MQIITPATNNPNSMYVIFPVFSPGIKTLPVAIVLIAGMLLINEDAFIVCGATKISALNNGIQKASSDAINKKNLFTL
jgi:hypothetical protein